MAELLFTSPRNPPLVGMGLIHLIDAHMGCGHVACIPGPGWIELLQFRDQSVPDIRIPVLINGVPDHNAGMISVAPHPIGIFSPDLFIPSMSLPVIPFVLEHHAIFISQVIPKIGNDSHADPHGIPVDGFRIVND